MYGTYGKEGEARSTYTLDNRRPATFTSPQRDPAQYHQRFYQSPRLEDGEHTLVIDVELDDGARYWLDYLIYVPSDPGSTAAAASTQALSSIFQDSSVTAVVDNSTGIDRHTTQPLLPSSSPSSPTAPSRSSVPPVGVPIAALIIGPYSGETEHSQYSRDSWRRVRGDCGDSRGTGHTSLSTTAVYKDFGNTQRLDAPDKYVSIQTHFLVVYRDAMTDPAALHSSGSAFDSQDPPAYPFAQAQYRYDTTVQKSARLHEQNSNHAARQSQQSATGRDQTSHEPLSSVQSVHQTADMSSGSPDMANRPYHAGSHDFASNIATWEGSNLSDLYPPLYNVSDPSQCQSSIGHSSSTTIHVI